MALPSIAPYGLPSASELPRARVDWRLSPGRAALLVHDMQRYFVDAFPAGSEPIRSVVANIVALREACDVAGVPVFYTAQNVRQDPAERGLQRDFWGPGMQSETGHKPIVPELAPRPRDRVLEKRRYSAFRLSTFGEELEALGRDQLLITGVFAHIGCLVTAADAFMREIQPFFVADAVADFSRAHHDLALAQVAGCTGRVLMANDAVGALLERVPRQESRRSSLNRPDGAQGLQALGTLPGAEALGLHPARAGDTQTRSAPTTMTKTDLKNDICGILQADAADVADTDNLIDHGLDSIRLMALVQKWTDRGVAVKFEDLAAYPEIDHWWNLVEAGRRE